MTIHPSEWIKGTWSFCFKGEVYHLTFKQQSKGSYLLRLKKETHDHPPLKIPLTLIRSTKSYIHLLFYQAGHPLQIMLLYHEKQQRPVLEILEEEVFKKNEELIWQEEAPYFQEETSTHSTYRHWQDGVWQSTVNPDYQFHFKRINTKTYEINIKNKGEFLSVASIGQSDNVSIFLRMHLSTTSQVQALELFPDIHQKEYIVETTYLISDHSIQRIGSEASSQIGQEVLPKWMLGTWCFSDYQDYQFSLDVNPLENEPVLYLERITGYIKPQSPIRLDTSLLQYTPCSFHFYAYDEEDKDFLHININLDEEEQKPRIEIQCEEVLNPTSRSPLYDQADYANMLMDKESFPSWLQGSWKTYLMGFYQLDIKRLSFHSLQAAILYNEEPRCIRSAPYVEPRGFILNVSAKKKSRYQETLRFFLDRQRRILRFQSISIVTPQDIQKINPS